MDCVENPNSSVEQMSNPMAPRVIMPKNVYLIAQVLHDVIRFSTGACGKNFIALIWQEKLARLTSKSMHGFQDLYN